MAYLTATRYGLVHIEPTEDQRASGWRQIWRHPESGALAMRHPSTGYWMVSFDGGITLDDGFSSSLRAAARKIERRFAQALERAAHQQGDHTSTPGYECYVCGRKAKPLHILVLSNKGWVCASDDFCTAGTSAERKRAV